jgi:hypothetical protein
MQSEYLSPAAARAELARLPEFPEDPHAVSAKPKLTAAIATVTDRRRS